MAASVATKFRAARFRQATADADVLLPPPLPLIKLPDEPRLVRTGAMEGRSMHLPVRRHLCPEQRNLAPEPNLQENRLLLDADAQQNEARAVLQRLHVYEYNQPDVYENSGAAEDTLVFDSLFECGNLLRAERVFRDGAPANRQEYELLIHPDIKNSAYRQWFYFDVRNGRRGVVYKFSLVNLAKSGALFGYGLQPCVYSEIDAQVKQRGWVHAGTHVRYDVSTSPHAPQGANALSFQYEFQHDNDRVYFACLQPYSYSDLVEYLDKLEQDSARSCFVRRTELCQTIAQNACELLSITASNKDGHVPPDEKKLIVISARVHPGEPNASWMMKGMIDYLTSQSSGAAVLRNNFVFKVVPMLNPDGVINGNTRVNLAGWDLNRKWSAPIEKLFPTVYHLKKLIANWQTRDRVAIYCDLHGHSINRNIFTYGCFNKRNNKKQNAAMNAAVNAAVADSADDNKTPPMFNPPPASTQPSVKNDPRVFPMIVAKNSEFFSFASCDFKVHKSKLNTARVVVNQELGVINSYTLEASFCGPDFGPRKDTQFNIWDLEDMGRQWCQSLLIYFGLLPQVRALDRQRDTERRQQQDQELARQDDPSIVDPVTGNAPSPELMILTPDAALLELNADILSDCEAAICELFAAVDLVDESVLAAGGDDDGVSSCDSDLSGAEDAIPPNNDADTLLGKPSIVMERRAVNGYSSAPEEYSCGGMKAIGKKLKRRSSTSPRKKNGKKGKKKSKSKRLAAEAEEGGGEDQQTGADENIRDDNEGQGEGALVEKPEKKRRKSKRLRKLRGGSMKVGRSRSFKERSKTAIEQEAHEGGSNSGRRMADIVLPDVPGASGRRQPTPPGVSEESVVLGVSRSSSFTSRKMTKKLFRIGSGEPLELPPVRPLQQQILHHEEDLKLSVRDPPDDGDEEEDEDDNEGEDGEDSSSSEASDPASVASEF